MCCNENFLEEAAESNTRWEITPAGRKLLPWVKLFGGATCVLIGMYIGAALAQF